MAVLVKGSNSATATSVAIPAHTAGDLLLLFAYRDDNNNYPTKPSASGTVPTWLDINSGHNNDNCNLTCYCVATADNHTTGTWTNATGIVVVVITGQQATSPIGGNATSGSSAQNQAVAPAISTLTRTDGTSGVIAFVGHRTVTAWGAAPTGYTRLTSAATSVCCNSRNVTTSAPSMTQTATAVNDVYRGAQVEILSLAAETGTAAGLLQRMTATAAGLWVPPTALLLQRALFAGAGQRIQEGTAAAVLRTATAEMAGKQTQTGTAETALPAATFAGVGEHQIIGAAAVRMRNAVTAMEAAQTQTGTIAASFELIEATVEGPRGYLEAQLEKVVASGEGGQTETGTIAAALTAARSTLLGWMMPAGGIAVTTRAPTATIVSKQIYTGVFAVEAPHPLLYTAVGVQTQRGTVAATMQHRHFAAVGAQPFTATIAITLRRRVFGGIAGVYTGLAYDASLATQCDQIWNFTRELRRVEDSLRKDQPLIRYWDAEWELQHIGGIEYRASFTWISNDTGPGQVEIPFDSPLAQWIHDQDGRIERGEGRNVCITVDYCGARWSGLMDKYAVEQREDGDVVLVVDWMHDYEHLKWYAVWSNPFLIPSHFQRSSNSPGLSSSPAPSTGHSKCACSSTCSANTTRSSHGPTTRSTSANGSPASTCPSGTWLSPQQDSYKQWDRVSCGRYQSHAGPHGMTWPTKCWKTQKCQSHVRAG